MPLRKLISYLLYFNFFVLCAAEFEPYIVGGVHTTIKKRPHCVYLKIDCDLKKGGQEFFSCGSSLINQQMLLTAAHCVYDCLPKSFISVHYANADKRHGLKETVSKFKLHENYNAHKVQNDLALLKLRNGLRLGSKVKRVALLKLPPYNEVGVVAGWGRIHALDNIKEPYLKEIPQKMIPLHKCKLKLKGHVYPGCFCAKDPGSEGFPARGDSGSALVVRDYIQIGLVSYRVPSKSKNIIVYTDVGYHYDWIIKNARAVYCS